MSRHASKRCAACGQPFGKSTQLSSRQWVARKFCSKHCFGVAESAANAAKRGDLEDRFNRLFEKSDGCWEWQGTLDGYGYGVIDHARKRYRAHVLALQYDGRPVERGQVACHHCDNPRCVRPDHLYPGTPADNARDASVRQRLAIGEKHPSAKLSEDQVRAIRKCGLTPTEAGRKFGISRPTARRIMDGLAWRHVQ